MIQLRPLLLSTRRAARKLNADLDWGYAGSTADQAARSGTQRRHGSGPPPLYRWRQGTK
jgi:hypothetical protein